MLQESSLFDSNDGTDVITTIIVTSHDFPRDLPVIAKNIRFARAKFEGDHQALADIDPPQNGVVFALALSEKAFDQLSNNAEFLSRKVGRIVQIFKSDRISNAHISYIANRILWNMYSKQLDFSRSLLSSISQLRIQHQSLQDSFSVLEAIANARGLSPFDLVFSDRSDNTIELQNKDQAAQVTEIRQKLPVSPYGIAALGISVHKLSEYGYHWTLSIVHVEKNHLIGQWQLSSGSGWFVRAFERTLAFNTGTLELRLVRDDSKFGFQRREPTEGEERIHLGDLCWSDGAAAQIIYSDKKIAFSDRAIAMRIWKRAPHISSQNAHVSSFAHLIALRDDLYNHARPVFPPKTNKGGELFRFIAHERAILCHPVPDALTIGSLGRVIPRDTEAIQIECIVDNEKSNIVEFAVAVAQTDASAVRTFCGDVSGTHDSLISSWTSVNYGEAVHIRIPVESYYDYSEYQVYIATRMLNGLSSDYAWAKIRQVAFVVAADQLL